MRRYAMPFRPGFDHMLYRLILVFFLLALCIGFAGYRYYDSQKQQIKQDIQDELSAIADLKVNQIQTWRNERISDAKVIAKNSGMASEIRRFLQNPDAPGAGHDILLWMNALREIADYPSILLCDPRGNIRLSTSREKKTVGSHAKKLIHEALRSGKAILSDFHRAPEADFPHLDLIAPLIAHQGSEAVPVGAVLIRLNPKEFLYPLIQSWPGASKTAETLLFRREGEDILYLNELRHRKHTALTLRVPVTTELLPAAMAVRGETGVFEGIDYRGVPVLAAIRPVSQTTWFLVAKVDIEEIYAPIRTQAKFLSVVIALLIAAAGLSIVFWWRQKSAEYARRHYKAESERKTLSQRYAYLSKYANDILLLVDPAGTIVEANDRAVEAYGYTQDELLRMNIRDIRPPETREATEAQMQQVRDRNGFIFETQHKRKDGALFPVEISSRIIEVEGQRYYQSIIRDITARKQAEALLSERNAFIEAILSNLPIGLAVNAIKDGKTIYMNAQFEKIYGWPGAILTDVEQFFTSVYPDPVSRKEIRERILSDMASGDPSRMRWDNVPITTQTGETRFVSAVNIPLFDQGLMISTVQDVTGRTHAEQAQLESERRYRLLLESVTDYIYTVTVENGLAVAAYHGPGCMAVTGYSSEEYQADPDLWSRMIFAEDRAAVISLTNRLLEGGSAPPFEHRIIHKDGSLRWVKNTPVPRYNGKGQLIAYDALVSDITQLKQLETQLRQSQKMEAVGQLAGGVAHDFNNILTAIIGYSNLLLMKMEAGSPGRPYLEQIISSSERAAHLTHSLLAFSRKQIIDLKPVKLNDIVKRVERLLGRVIGEDVEFRISLTEAGLPILADSVQIEQVLMNLAANARDAMPDGGTLLIETKRIELGEDFVRSHDYGKPGSYAYLAVTDTGIGMDEKIKERIFEPFFTTKDVGKGTGLGLAMVYGIIKQHNGFINVYSESGKGTTFKIYLPLTTSAAEVANAAAPAEIARGSETVLVAEDDEAVRKLTRSVLENFGYLVIESADGEDAVRKFIENKDRIDLLIFDIIMPRKNGKEAYLEIEKIRPDIKVLFTSGYTADIVHRKGILDSGLDFILKPIAPADFLRKVREVLDRN